jgi:hypothetical protein
MRQAKLPDAHLNFQIKSEASSCEQNLLRIRKLIDDGKGRNECPNNHNVSKSTTYMPSDSLKQEERLKKTTSSTRQGGGRLSLC